MWFGLKLLCAIWESEIIHGRSRMKTVLRCTDRCIRQSDLNTIALSPLADSLKIKGTILQYFPVRSLIPRELCRPQDQILYILPHQIAAYLPTSLSSLLMWNRNDTEFIFAVLTIDMCWCCRAGFYQALVNRLIVCIRSASQRAANPATSHAWRMCLTLSSCIFKGPFKVPTRMGFLARLQCN